MNDKYTDISFGDAHTRIFDGSLGDKIQNRVVEIMMRGVSAEEIIRAKAEEILKVDAYAREAKTSRLWVISRIVEGFLADKEDRF
jgi:hypothetical protein